MSNSFVGGCFGVAFLLIWSAFTLLFDGFVLWGIARQLMATTYPSAAGVITHSVVQSSSDGEGTTYRPELRFDYTVAGMAYTGTRYRYQVVASGQGNARQIVAGHPVGQQVAVRYNPSDPANSVLQTGVEGIDLFLILFLTPFNVVMLAFWWAAWNSRRRFDPEVPFSGFTVRQADGLLHVCLNDPRLPSAVLTAGGLSFVLIFLLGFCVGFNPSLPLMAGVWVAVGAACVLAYLKPWTFGATPRALVLDEAGQTLRIYRHSLETPDMEIAGASICAVTVEKAEHTDSDGDTVCKYVPTVRFAERHGAENKEPLGEWAEPAAAAAVANGLYWWLRNAGHQLPQPEGTAPPE
jgi:hypothetical protein